MVVVEEGQNMTIFLKIWVNEEDYMTDQTEIILKGRLKGYQRMRLIKLLDMEYTPGELAIEVGFNRRQVYRVYMHQGCPHRRDNKRRLWINGKEFQEWSKDAADQFGYSVTFEEIGDRHETLGTPTQAGVFIKNG